MSEIIARDYLSPQDLAPFLEETLVGQTVVKVEGTHIYLRNGTILELEEAYDCCAGGDVTILPKGIEGATITGVSTEDNQKINWENDGDIKIFLLAESSVVAEVDHTWGIGTGYYFYGLHYTVRKVV